MNFSKLLVPAPEPLHISIAGLIGVGKSTLALSLANYFHAELIKEPVEENPFLAEFYAEMAQPNHPLPMLTAYPLQMALLSQRTAAVRVHLNSTRTLVNDRSPYEDAIFVGMLERSGKMSRMQAENYLQIFNTCFSLLPKPTVIVWLRASPETCFNRICRRSRDMEVNVTLEYLQQLDEAYEEFFAAMQGRIPILIIDREESSEPGTLNYENEVASVAEQIETFRRTTQKKLFISD